MSKLKFVVSCAGITGAFKKSAIAANMDYQIIAKDRVDESGYCTFGLSACAPNVMAQAKILFKGKLLEMDHDTKPIFICGNELEKVVTAMASMGKDIIFDYTGNEVEISNGAAKTHVSCKQEMSSITSEKGDVSVGVLLTTENLKLAVSKGANYTPVEDTLVAKDTLALKICNVNGKQVMRIFSSDMKKGSLCEVPIIQAGYIPAKRGEENTFKEAVFSLKCSMLDFVVNFLEEDDVQMLFHASTVNIKCGNVVYTLGLFEKNFPKEVENVFFRQEGSVKVSLSKKEMMAAISLAAITSDGSKPLVLSIKENSISVSDFYGKSETFVEAEVEGAEIEQINYSFSQLKAILAKTSSDVVTFSIGEKKPAHIFDSVPGAVAFLMPVVMNNM